MSIDLVIGGDHGKGVLRASIKSNAKFTSGINITRIFKLAHFQCKKNNGDIMGNTLIFPIGYRLNNICNGQFLGWTNEGKTQFRVMPHGFPLPPPREKIICSSVRTLVFFTRDITVYAVLLRK